MKILNNMKQKIQNFFNILELILPDKFDCLAIGMYLGIFISLFDTNWNVNPIPIYIMGIFIVLIIGLIGLNYFELKAILKNKD